MLTHSKVMEAQSTDEHVHHSSSGATASHGRNQHGACHHGDRDRATATDRRHSSSGWTCWHCGSKERHSQKQCSASKPVVVCSHCLGRNHFAVVFRSPKDFFKKANQGRRQSPKEGKPVHTLDHAVLSTKEDSGDDFYLFAMDESVHAMPSAASKLFTTLSLSASVNSFTNVKFQVDSAAICNTLPYHHFKRIGKDVDLQPTFAKLISYSGESIRPLGKVTLVHQTPQFYMLMDFHVVDLLCKPALLGLPDSIRLSLLEVDSSRVTVHPEQPATPNLQDCEEVSSPVSSAASLAKEEILQ